MQYYDYRNKGIKTMIKQLTFALTSSNISITDKLGVLFTCAMIAAIAFKAVNGVF